MLNLEELSPTDASFLTYPFRIHLWLQLSRSFLLVCKQFFDF